jgi:hypothetical protein
MMPGVIMIVMVAVTAVSAAFGLERNLHLYKIRSESMEHLLDHMVGPNADNLVLNFNWQMPISQMPGKPRKLIRVFMPDLDNRLRSGLNLEPPPIFKLQAFGHRDRFRKIEKDVFALIRRQANATAMARIEIESESACRIFLRPQTGRSMN